MNVACVPLLHLKFFKRAFPQNSDGKAVLRLPGHVFHPKISSLDLQTELPEEVGVYSDGQCLCTRLDRPLGPCGATAPPRWDRAL